MPLCAATYAASTIAAEMSINPDSVAFIRSRLHLSHEDVMIFLREFTQNAIDAGATRLEWCFTEVDGVEKLTLIEDGHGFFPDTMEGHLKELYRSGREQGLGKNFGVGGKSAGTAFSPYGVEYFTRCKGETHFRHALLVDLPDGRCGLVAGPHGTAITTLTRNEVPAEFAKYEHGTMTIFHGVGPDHVTTAAPDGALGARDWVARYLNMRYFSIPEGVKLIVKTRRSRNDKKPNTVALQGVSGVLDKHEPTPQSGVVTLRVPDLGTVTVRWYLDHVGVKLHTTNGREQHGTQIGALYNNECHDRPRDAAGNRARLAHFGIRSTAARVSLFVELPEAWKPNEARSHVALNGAAVLPDWPKIGGCFQAAMPDALVKAERDATRSMCNDAKGDWRNELEGYMAAVATWRFDANGAETAVCDQLGTRDRTGEGPGGAHPNTAERLAPTPQENRHGVMPGNDPAHPTRARASGSVPLMRLVRAVDMDDESNAVEWRREMNVLYVNEASHAWRALVAAAQASTLDALGSDEVANEAACHAAGLVLAGQVINAELLRRDPAVTNEDRRQRYDQATSPATLSVLLAPSPATVTLVRQRLASAKRLRKTA